MSTVAQWLAKARIAGVDRLDAQLLLAHHLGQSRTWLLAHGDAAVADRSGDAFQAACGERARGVPLAYLVGTREFHGLTLRVTRDVLVPRPDTELLVDWALELLAGPLSAVRTPDVADLGTGSGAVALAVKHRCSRARLHAIDRSAAALDVARWNARSHGLEVTFALGDWLTGLGTRRFDLLLSNPPYIDAADPHLAALHAEPRLALTPGADGLSALRDIAAQAPAHLHDGGWLLLEHGHTQGPAVVAALRAVGFVDVRTRQDLAGQARCTGGRWIGPDTPASA